MRSAIVLTCVFLGACSLPFTGGSSDGDKAPCDRIAAQAIQTSDLENAKNLAAQASECYAAVQAD